MDALRQSAVHWWAAVTMYYKPWAVRGFVDAGYPFNDSRYYDRLRRGHQALAESMEDVRALKELGIGSFLRDGKK